MNDIKILRIEFDHHREIVTVIFREEDKSHFAQFFSFIVWNENNCFNAADLTNLIIKYSQKTES